MIDVGRSSLVFSIVLIWVLEGFCGWVSDGGLCRGVCTVPELSGSWQHVESVICVDFRYVYAGYVRELKKHPSNTAGVDRNSCLTRITNPSEKHPVWIRRCDNINSKISQVEYLKAKKKKGILRKCQLYITWACFLSYPSSALYLLIHSLEQTEHLQSITRHFFKLPTWKWEWHHFLS